MKILIIKLLDCGTNPHVNDDYLFKTKDKY